MALRTQEVVFKVAFDRNGRGRAPVFVGKIVHTPVEDLCEESCAIAEVENLYEESRAIPTFHEGRLYNTSILFVEHEEKFQLSFKDVNKIPS